ncbi:MAG: hypothetical protein ABW198_04745 [Pseudorhodoplanes sp.]
MRKPALKARDEQQFFEDPAIDRLMGFAFALSAEVYVLRDRVSRLETLLTSKGLIKPGETELPRTLEQQAAMNRDRDAFVAAIMDPIKGLQKSNGAF